jgi:hypothetical protein
LFEIVERDILLVRAKAVVLRTMPTHAMKPA